MSYNNIIVSYQQMNHEQFHSAMQRLGIQVMPLSCSMQLKRINKEVEKLRAAAQKEYQKLLEEFGSKDDDGKLKIDEPTGMPHVEKEKQKDFAKSLQEFMRTERTIELTPINVHKMGEAIRVSGADLEILEGILVE